MSGVVVTLLILGAAVGGWWYVNEREVPSSVQIPIQQESTNTKAAVKPVATPKTTTQPSQTPPASIPQLTKTLVLNGYDKCGVQFKDGELSIGWDKYQELEPTCGDAVAGASIVSDGIVFADLDNDGISEAIAAARIVRASSGGALYVFKNVNGVARVVAVAIIGKENIQITSVTGNTIVGKTDGAMGYPPTTKTFVFANGQLTER